MNITRKNMKRKTTGKSFKLIVYYEQFIIKREGKEDADKKKYTIKSGTGNYNRFC